MSLGTFDLILNEP